MHTLIINIENKNLAKKIICMLEDFKKDGLEIVEKESLEDLKILKNTRNEKTLSLAKYFKSYK